MIPDVWKNAILSVYTKDGIDEFAEGLMDLGWRIYSSGGTAKFLRERNIPVIDTADYIGAAILSQIVNIAREYNHELPPAVARAIHAAFGKPIMAHRVATMWPQIHGGILRRDGVSSDIEELEAMCAVRFELVCVDMYPLAEEAQREGATYESVIEKTDIGGPTLLRAAGKAGRITICQPEDRMWVLDHLKQDGNLSDAARRWLFVKVEHAISVYCAWSAWFHGQGSFPKTYAKPTE